MHCSVVVVHVFHAKKFKLGLQKSLEFTVSIKTGTLQRVKRFGSFKFDEDCFRSANGTVEVKVAKTFENIITYPLHKFCLCLYGEK